MAGRLPSILRRRDGAPAAPEQPAEAAGETAAPDAPAPPSSEAAPDAAPQATTVHAPAAPGGPEAAPPAGPDVAVVPGPDATGEQLPPLSPGFRDRGRLRRRLRYLREVRELGYRDLGGLVFDLHRFGRPGEELVRGKLEALAAVDRELRALSRAVDDRHDYVDLRQAGVAACPRCAALHGSDANFCPACGLALDGSSVGAAGVATAEASERVAPPVQVPLWGSGTVPGAPAPPQGDRPHAPAQPLLGGQGGPGATPDAPTQSLDAPTGRHPAPPPPGAPGT